MSVLLKHVHWTVISLPSRYLPIVVFLFEPMLTPALWISEPRPVCDWGVCSPQVRP